jgi:hypothetical protein
MVDDEPIPAAVACVLVAMIGRGDGWPSKAAIVLLIAGHEGGGWFTSNDLADYTGRTPGPCRRALQELEAERVVLRDGGEGGRLFWCELNPEWEAWRVPWRFPIRVMRQRVAYARQEAAQSAMERFIARPYVARYPRISARLVARDKAARIAAESHLSRAMVARDNGARPEAHRAKTGGFGVRGGVSSRAMVARDNSALGRVVESPRSVPASASDPDNRLFSAAGHVVHGIAVDEAAWQRARRIVLQRTVGPQGRRPFLAGAVARQLAELVAAHDVDRLEAAADTIPAGTELPPGFVAMLADVVTGAYGDQPPAAVAVSPFLDYHQAAEPPTAADLDPDPAGEVRAAARQALRQREPAPDLASSA